MCKLNGELPLLCHILIVLTAVAKISKGVNKKRQFVLTGSHIVIIENCQRGWKNYGWAGKRKVIYHQYYIRTSSTPSGD